MAEWIGSYMPKSMDLYVECFGGAFWTYIKNNFVAKEVVYNDFNRYMANIFACSKHPDEFLSYLTKIKPQDKELFNKFKQTILQRDTFDLPDFDIATMYIYIVTQTFSGIMSEKVEMVDLHGKYRSKYYSFMNKLKTPSIRRRLDRVTVYNKSYDEILDMYDGKTFNKNRYFYLDPPYFTKEHLYAFHEFGRESHEVLANKLQNLNNRWLLSYYHFNELNTWYPNNKYIRETMEFNKSSMATKNKYQTIGQELLIMNYKPVYSF